MLWRSSPSILRFVSLALESRLALWNHFYPKNMAAEMLHQHLGPGLQERQLPLPASWNAHAEESQPLLLRLSHSEQVGARHFERSNGEKRPASARHSNHPQPGSRCVSAKCHLGHRETPRNSDHRQNRGGSHSAQWGTQQRPQLSGGGDGAPLLCPASFPDPRNCM